MLKINVFNVTCLKILKKRLTFIFVIVLLTYELTLGVMLKHFSKALTVLWFINVQLTRNTYSLDCNCQSNSCNIIASILFYNHIPCKGKKQNLSSLLSCWFPYRVDRLLLTFKDFPSNGNLFIGEKRECVYSIIISNHYRNLATH